MTGDAEFVTGDHRWHNFLPGISPLGLFFTGVEASGVLSRDVVVHVTTYTLKQRDIHYNISCLPRCPTRRR